MSTALDPAALLRVSADIARRLATARDAVSVGRTVLPALAETLGADVANLALRVDERTLRLIAAVGLSRAVVSEWSEFDIAAAIPLAATVRDGQARWLPDTHAARRDYPAVPNGSSASLCTLPLLDGDAVIGVLGLAWRQRHEFGDAEQQLLLTVAALASATLARQPLPVTSRLEPRSHGDVPGLSGVPGLSVAELARTGAARCVVRLPSPADPGSGHAGYVTLLDAGSDPRSRTMQAADGVLSLFRRRRMPPALAAQALADLAPDLDGAVTGAHLEIAGDGSWLAVAPLDGVAVLATTGHGGRTSARRHARLDERILLPRPGRPAAVLAATVDAGTAPDLGRDIADAAARIVEAVVEAAGDVATISADGVVRAFLSELRRRESDECVRGAVAVVLTGGALDPHRPARRRLPALPVSAGLARRFAVAALTEEERAANADRVSLVVDELVANAIRHANETVEVVVTRRPDGIEVGVTDDDDRHPDPHAGPGDAGTPAESGRGYTLLSALADELGVTPRAAGGKVVWARIAW